MKFAAVLVSSLAFASTVVAQGSHIGYPKTGAVVHKGKKTTVQIVRPNSIMGSTEVGLVLSFQYCQKPNPCPPANNQLGSVLFVGKLNPQFHEIPGQPYQNFTVTIPNFDFWAPGPAQIISTRFHLIGAGPAPVLETNVVNVTLKN
ncbi:hypothetical protein P691DRAFT_711983 [Macrolepiota fuliginosa MF-IS2]|uniref:Uncharacterized protein n=1 Tax=Macrolepiota fuliginosa MF-IS2 TaxID=1400762 RepID=A0A9P5X5D3_9AGAR|nr:hypothetical protein P691DRAFT_711983 [Macrolepiota fuliginosa MF-IS2]